MKKYIIESKWHKIKGNIKKRYAFLTHRELTYQEGKFEEMLGNLMEKTGKSEKELLEEAEESKPE